MGPNPLFKMGGEGEGFAGDMDMLGNNILFDKKNIWTTSFHIVEEGKMTS